MRLVLVSCCAPCSAGAIKQLADGAIPDVDDFIVLFFNPNIYPADEYMRRMAEQIRYCDSLGVRHVELEYDHDAWRRAVAGYEASPERGPRCGICFAYRFARAAEFARENGYDALASVLGVSRHKDQAQVDAAAIAAITEFNATPRRLSPPPPAGAVGIDPADSDIMSPETYPRGYNSRGTAIIHQRRYTNAALSKSKVLKRNMTDAERLLWHYLRGRTDFSFRKQAPIGNYIVDFVCMKHKLIIELDGAQHGDEKHYIHDKVRDDFLGGLGYKILRFWNDEVFKNMNMVLNTIYENLAVHRPVTADAVLRTPPAGAVGFGVGPTSHPTDNEYIDTGSDVMPTAQAGGDAQNGHRGVANPEIKYIPIKWDENLRIQINRESDFYRQNYCGCEFSMRK